MFQDGTSSSKLSTSFSTRSWTKQDIGNIVKNRIASLQSRSFIDKDLIKKLKENIVLLLISHKIEHWQGKQCKPKNFLFHN